MIAFVGDRTIENINRAKTLRGIQSATGHFTRSKNTQLTHVEAKTYTLFYGDELGAKTITNYIKEPTR